MLVTGLLRLTRFRDRIRVRNRVRSSVDVWNAVSVGNTNHGVILVGACVEQSYIEQLTKNMRVHTV